MRRTRRHRTAGQGMVEFAVVIPVFLAFLFGIIDFGRYSQIQDSVAEAARQGARQAVPNAAAADSPFGAVGGSCSGQVYAANASGTGCLTDQAIETTVAAALNGVLKPSSITLESDTTASACNALANLAAGQAYVCISPSDGTAGNVTSHQTACPSGYPSPPSPAYVSRQSEWQSQNLKGCFYVTVTVIYFYRPWTPGLSNLMGTRKISGSTSMLAEY